MSFLYRKKTNQTGPRAKHNRLEEELKTEAFLVLFNSIYCHLMISRIDNDGSLSVEWEEFRNFMQLAPSGDLEDLVSYWRQNLVSRQEHRPFHTKTRVFCILRVHRF